MTKANMKIAWALLPAGRHSRTDVKWTTVKPVKDYVWCNAESRPHRGDLHRCAGLHYPMLRTTSAPGLRRGKHEVRR